MNTYFTCKSQYLKVAGDVDMGLQFETPQNSRLPSTGVIGQLAH